MTRFVLTGPTGWIGTAFLAALAAEGGLGWTREVRLFGSGARRLIAPDGSSLEVRALDDLRGADVEGARLIHLAYMTKEKVAALGAKAFMAGNSAIDDRVLDAVSAGRPASVFVASSGAARQAEPRLGRELYGLCKLTWRGRVMLGPCNPTPAPRVLVAGAATSVPVLTGRIFNLAGPYINKIDSYAVSAFLKQAFTSNAVRIEARTPVYRSYLHISDLCSLVLGALSRGMATGKAIDLCGALVVEMEDVAREALRAARADGGVERGRIDFDRPSLYLGDPEPARTLALRLGLHLKSFAHQMDDTADHLRSVAAPAVDRLRPAT